MATVRTSRKNGIIVIDLTEGENAKEVKGALKEALIDFKHFGLSVDPGMSRSRLYVSVDTNKLDELSPTDRENTWVGLREGVQTVLGG